MALQSVLFVLPVNLAGQTSASPASQFTGAVFEHYYKRSSVVTPPRDRLHSTLYPFPIHWNIQNVIAISVSSCFISQKFRNILQEYILYTYIYIQEGKLSKCFLMHIVHFSVGLLNIHQHSSEIRGLWFMHFYYEKPRIFSSIISLQDIW